MKLYQYIVNNPEFMFVCHV